MEHDIPFGNSNRENGTTFLDFPLFLGIFQWDEPTKRVPFTAEPEIPEILTKWKAPHISLVWGSAQARASGAGRAPLILFKIQAWILSKLLTWCPFCKLPFLQCLFACCLFLCDTQMIVAFYRGFFFFFTNLDSVYFRFDLTLFTFRLLNFVIDIAPYKNTTSEAKEQQFTISIKGNTMYL